MERNAQRSGLVEKAEDWPWSSVYARLYGDEKQLLSLWPVAEPKDYVPWLNHPQPREEIENIRCAIKRSRPYGSEAWVSKAVAQFGLENTIRNPWRPEKGTWHRSYVWPVIPRSRRRRGISHCLENTQSEIPRGVYPERAERDSSPATAGSE